ncbi:MAG TPA: PIG-L deacetylase family protein [Bryobacteraceae bacterium]|nr:PIG-L deacetylase family protein [Bryobacteraceae bacterium]
METQKTVLVVSAHAADFVWRAAGAMALLSERGYRVRVLCLSYGERGESERLWKIPGMTVERVKDDRQQEASRAAEILGAEIRFFDMGDYPIQPTEEKIVELVNEFREHKPEVVLTHSFLDPYNPDHPMANDLTLKARVYSQASGYPAKGKGKQDDAPPVFLFEPHQPEQCQFKPQVLLDITPVWGKKLKAMESMAAQEHLVQYYTDLGKRRGVQAVRNSGRRQIQYAEAYERVYPQVTDVLS